MESWAAVVVVVVVEVVVTVLLKSPQQMIAESHADCLVGNWEMEKCPDTLSQCMLVFGAVVCRSVGGDGTRGGDGGEDNEDDVRYLEQQELEALRTSTIQLGLQ